MGTVIFRKQPTPNLPPSEGGGVGCTTLTIKQKPALQVVHGQPTVGQYTAAATAYPAPAPGTAVPVGYSAAAAASAATSYAAARPAASVLPAAAYSAYPQAAPTYAASAAPATSIVATAGPAYSYQAQYATPGLPTASGPSAVAAAYYPQASVAAGVTYAGGDSYQARPTYSHAHAQVAAMAARQPIVTATTRPVTSYVPAPAYTSAYSSAAYTPTTSYAYQHSTMPTTSYPPPILTYPQPGSMPSSVTAAAKPNIYVQPQAATTINIVPAPGAPKVGQWRAVKPSGPPGVQQARVFKGPRIPPKPQQLHYCEVCKISCAGPQTYKEHLEGQKHKKKEASMKTGTSGPTTRGGNALRCELCDVTCTGSDAYAAHIRGAKHQKVVKLHTKLGKPIPSVDPVLVTKGAGNPSGPGPSAPTATTPTGPPPALANPPQSIANLAKPPQSYAPVRQPAVPKITFVGSDKIKPEVKVEVKPVVAKPYQSTYVEQEVTIPRLPEEKDVQPVGHDYIEEIKNDEGKVISFSCKLCECRFNDPNAKEMHMKGRRHRLQYKKKVNPDLVVDIKPSLRQRKMQEERAKRSQAREEFWKRREEEFRLMEEEERVYWAERRRFEEEMDDANWYRRFPGRGAAPPGPPGAGARFGPQGPHGPFSPHFMMRRPDTVDDRHCVAKHDLIFPADDELEAVQRIVTHTETAMKKVSDHLAALDVGGEKKVKVVKEEEKGEEGKPDSQRLLVGVMRVGLLAKQLLLKGDTAVALVVLCGEKPTKSLLERIATNLPAQLAEVAPEEQYEVTRVIEHASLVVAGKGLTVTITLTSPLMRETAEETAAAGTVDPPDVLDHDRCIAALAELRHVKWFHSRALSRHSCTIVIRILRDLCLRNPTWAPLHCWAIELLVEKVLNSAGVPLTPGDALRRVFEALAGGILLPDSPGFLDPCEKEPMDAANSLSSQEREDVTSSSQHALRLIAFRQVHKVSSL